MTSQAKYLNIYPLKSTGWIVTTGYFDIRSNSKQTWLLLVLVWNKAGQKCISIRIICKGAYSETAASARKSGTQGILFQ
jgi:hypothetical protein